jgi:hypothetical protein
MERLSYPLPLAGEGGSFSNGSSSSLSWPLRTDESLPGYFQTG